MSSPLCAYSRCDEVAAGHLLMRREKFPMCEKHLDPKMHPPDLRKNLTRWKVRS